MHILVCGAGGYLGKNICSSLAAAGHDVVGLTRSPRQISGAEVWIASNPIDIERLNVTPGQFDLIINCAAAGVHPADRDPQALVRANSVLPQVLVECAARWQVGALLQIGSSAEYAEVAGDILLREDAALATTRLYGATKAAGGLLALATGAQLGVPVSVLRLFNLFGPAEAPHRLLPFLVSQLRKGAAVPLSRGTQLRDFISVSDTCQAIQAAADLLIMRPETAGIYNLCTGRETSVAEFSLMVANALGADPALLQFGARPMRPDDYGFVVGAPQRFSEATGWSANSSLGIEIEAAVRQELDFIR